MEHQAVYDRLVQAARARELVHYAELAKMLGIDMDNPHFAAQVGKVLGRISEDEVAAGRPMLSAIVVSKDTMLPGKGFFNLGTQLRKTEPGEDEITFAVRQIKATHAYWRSTDAHSQPEGRTDPEPAAKPGVAEAFADAGLPAPPIPASLRPNLRKIQDWCWATRDIDPMEMYLFRYPLEAVSAGMEDHIAVSHAGHGVNSYSINYQLAYGPVLIFTQTLWGGVYVDAAEQTELVAEQFARTAALIDAVDALPAAARGSGRLVVLESEFRSTRLCAWLDSPVGSTDAAQRWLSEHEEKGVDPISAAVGWLRALASRQAAGG